MRQIVLPLVFLCIVASSVRADHPAIRFHLLKTKDLKELLPEKIRPSKLDLTKLSDIEIAHGYFEKDCSVYLKTKEYQYRIQAKTEEKALSFSLSMFSQETKKSVFSSSGEVKLPKDFHVPILKAGWRDEDYVVVWYRENLKK